MNWYYFYLALRGRTSRISENALTQVLKEHDIPLCLFDFAIDLEEYFELTENTNE